jgi:hypothetical protein
MNCSQEWKTNEPRYKWTEKQKEEIPRTMQTIEGKGPWTETQVVGPAVEWWDRVV